MGGGNSTLPGAPEVINVQPAFAGLTNADMILMELRRINFDGGQNIADYLNDASEGNPLLTDFDKALTFIRIVLRHESSNPDSFASLQSLEADIARCVDLTTQGQPASLLPENAATLNNVFSDLREFKLILDDSHGQLDDVLEEGTNMASGFITTLRENTAGMSDLQTSSLYGAAFLGILWAYTSKSDTAGALRSGVEWLATRGLALYGVNAATRLFTGDSILGNLQSLNRRNNDEITEHFGLDPDIPSHNLIINALLDSTLEEEKLANDTSFATMISAYNPNSETLPDFIYTGTTSFDTPDKREALHDAVGLIYNKYGPGSSLNQPGSDIEARWNFAMENSAVSWQQGIFQLMALDNEDLDLHPTYTEAIMDFIGYRAELVASPVVTWSMETFETVSDQIPGGVVGFMDALRRLVPGGNPDTGQLRNFLDIEITSSEQIANLSGSYGRFAYAALNSNNQNHIFEDSAGVAYTTVNLPINSPDMLDQSLQHLKIVDAYVTAFSRFAREYPEDDNLAENINVLFGARNSTTGTYSIAFTYAPENSLARANEMLRPVGIDNGMTFGFDAFTPAEKAYALYFYQCDEDKFVTEYLPAIIAGMPSDTDTTNEKFEYMFNPALRESIIVNSGASFSPELVALYNELEIRNANYADRLSNDTQKTLFYNAVGVMHSLFVNPNTRSIVGLSASATNEDVIAAYEAYLENYFTEFNSANLGDLELLSVNYDPNNTDTSRRIESADDFDFEIATQRYFNSLCDQERTSPPNPVPFMTWSFEYASTEPTLGQFSVESLEMVPNSVIFMGEGTAINFNNSIVEGWYKDKTYRMANGSTVDFDTAFSYDSTSNTYTANQDLYIRAESTNQPLQKGVRMSGNLYYYLQN